MSKLRMLLFFLTGVLITSNAAAADQKKTVKLQGHKWFVTSLAFSKDGSRLASGDFNGVVIYWDVKNRKKLQSFKAYDSNGLDPVHSLAFSSRTGQLATASWGRRLKLWNSSGKLNGTMAGHENGRGSIAFSPSGEFLAAPDLMSNIVLWDMKTAKKYATLKKGDSPWGQSFAFSPDGKFLASVGEGGIELWDVKRAKLLKQMSGHKGVVLCVAFSPDGRLLATGGMDKTLRIWSVEKHRELHCLKGHSDRIYCVAFTPNGKKIATGSEDKSIKLWSVHDHKEINTLKLHSDAVFTVAFSPDGKLLASSGGDSVIVLSPVEDLQKD